MVLACGIALSTIDEWCFAQKLRKTFFADRIVQSGKPDTKHIKAFAAEMLQAISMMGLFLDIVIVPLGILGEHVDCLKMLVAIISLLQVGDISRTSELRTAIHTYHVLFLRLYPKCAKTKLHAIQHIVDCWEHWMTLLSCFGPERKHKLMKKSNAIFI